MKSAVFATLVSLAAAVPQGPPAWITSAASAGWGPHGAFPTNLASVVGSSYASDYSSWFSKHSSDWASLTSAYGTNWAAWSSAIATMTSDPPPWASGSGVPFGPGGPFGGPPGWAGPGGYGPGGHGWRGPPFANGNGFGPFQSGAWTNGPWTAWWNANGTAACPPATWSGWTNGPWGSTAPWTTWSACTATTTATSVVTTTNAAGQTTTTTSFGVAAAEATGTNALQPTSAQTGAADKRTAAMGGMIVAGLAAVVAL